MANHSWYVANVRLYQCQKATAKRGAVRDNMLDVCINLIYINETTAYMIIENINKYM